MWQDFKNCNFNALNLSFLNVLAAGRLKCCGMKDHTVVDHSCQKTKKIICGMEGKNGWLLAACLVPLVMFICYAF